jgi:hypothetical protein
LTIPERSWGGPTNTWKLSTKKPGRSENATRTRSPENSTRTRNGLTFRIHITEEPPFRLGLIFGDFLYNLRSALDNLITQLVLLAGNTPGKHNQFPILDRPDKWKTGGTGNGAARSPCVPFRSPVLPVLAGAQSARLSANSGLRSPAAGRLLAGHRREHCSA